MNNKLISGLLVLALVLGAWGVLKPAQVKIVAERVTNLGSAAGPDIPFDYLRIGSLTLRPKHAEFGGTATSTPCVFQVTSTSTLLYASLKINNPTTTATTWTVAKATGANATTTVLTTFPALASGAQGTMVATTTAGTLIANANGEGVKPDVDGLTVFSPNQYLVWGVTGLTYTGYDSTKLGGQCDALFIEG